MEAIKAFKNFLRHHKEVWKLKLKQIFILTQFSEMQGAGRVNSFHPSDLFQCPLRTSQKHFNVRWKIHTNSGFSIFSGGIERDKRYGIRKQSYSEISLKYSIEKTIAIPIFNRRYPWGVNQELKNIARWMVYSCLKNV